MATVLAVLGDVAIAAGGVLLGTFILLVLSQEEHS